MIGAIFIVPKGPSRIAPPASKNARQTPVSRKTMSKASNASVSTDPARVPTKADASKPAATPSWQKRMERDGYLPQSILTLNSYPSRAQVLLLVGRSPVVVPKLPVGVFHEFIAINDEGRSWRAVGAIDPSGRAGSRCIEPSRHEERQGESLARAKAVGTLNPVCEIAISIGKRGIRRPGWDLGPTHLPREVGARADLLGAVRVVTKPPGIKVYQLVGFTPDALIENLSTTETSELLVYASGYQIEKINVPSSSWQAGEIPSVVSFDVSLRPRFP